jgi:hypothetical protein
MIDEVILRKIRQEAKEAKPKEVGKTQKLSREEVLLEAEYILKKGILMNEDLNKIFYLIFGYLKKAGYDDIKPPELIRFLFREIK